MRYSGLPGDKPDDATEQSRREAAALRANLRRRKQQTQARVAALNDPAPSNDRLDDGVSEMPIGPK